MYFPYFSISFHIFLTIWLGSRKMNHCLSEFLGLGFWICLYLAMRQHQPFGLNDEKQSLRTSAVRQSPSKGGTFSALWQRPTIELNSHLLVLNLNAETCWNISTLLHQCPDLGYQAVRENNARQLRIARNVEEEDCKWPPDRFAWNRLCPYFGRWLGCERGALWMVWVKS